MKSNIKINEEIIYKEMQETFNSCKFYLLNNKSINTSSYTKKLKSNKELFFDFNLSLSGSITIQIIDIRNSSKLISDYKKAYYTFSIFHNAISIIANLHSGIVYECTGDGIIIFFKFEKEVTQIVYELSKFIMHKARNFINTFLCKINLEPINIGIGLSCGEYLVNSYEPFSIFCPSIWKADKLSKGINKINICENIEKYITI